MAVGPEFILGFIGTVVLAVLGYLLARSISQIDKNLEQLNENLEAISTRVAILEWSVKHLESNKLP